MVAAKVLNVTLIPGIKLIKNNNAKLRIGPTKTLTPEYIQTKESPAAFLNETFPKVQPIAIQTIGEARFPNVFIVS